MLFFKSQNVPILTVLLFACLCDDSWCQLLIADLQICWADYWFPGTNRQLWFYWWGTELANDDWRQQLTKDRAISASLAGLKLSWAGGRETAQQKNIFGVTSNKSWQYLKLTTSLSTLWKETDMSLPPNRCDRISLSPKKFMILKNII